MPPGANGPVEPPPARYHPQSGRHEHRVVGTAAQTVATVEVDDRSGQPAGLGADQEADERGDLCRFADPGEGRVVDVARVDRAVPGDRGHQLGRGEPGPYRVETQTAVAVLVCGVAHQLLDAGLGRRIGT